MKEAEAIGFLGLSTDADEEHIQDAYENYCFEVRQKALMNLAVPRLMKKRIQALESAQEAYRTLLGVEEGELPRISYAALISFEKACEHLGTPPPWTPCVRVFEQMAGEARLGIANSFSAAPLAKSIASALEYQQAYHRILYEGFAPVFLHPKYFPVCTSVANKEVKAGQAAYSGTLLQDLEELERHSIGNEGIDQVAKELEQLMPEKNGAASRILTEVQRIHQLHLLDEKKGDR